MKRTIVTVAGAVLGYTLLSYLVTNTFWMNPIEMVTGIAFAFAWATGMPEILAWIIAGLIVLGVMGLGVFVARKISTRF